MIDCLDEDEIGRYAEQTATLDESAKFADHVSQCRSCRHLIAAVLSSPRPVGEKLAQVPADATDPLVGIFFGCYEVVEALGRGANGLVYRATDPSLGHFVALKVLRTLTDAQRQTLLIERTALARIKHPNVVRVYDTGEIKRDDGVELFVANGAC